MSSSLTEQLQQAAEYLAATGLEGDWSKLPTRYERPGFETLCRIMAFQQLSGRQALHICTAIEEAHGGRFPAAQELDGASLAAFVDAGVAPFRVQFIANLAAGVREGTISIPTEPGPDAERALLSIRGVGPWTCDMYRMFALGELDVWPTGDVGLRKGLAIHKGTRADMSGAEWAPFRTMATWFLWQLVPNFPLPGFRAPPESRTQTTLRSFQPGPGASAGATG